MPSFFRIPRFRLRASLVPAFQVEQSRSGTWNCGCDCDGIRVSRGIDSKCTRGRNQTGRTRCKRSRDSGRAPLAELLSETLCLDPIGVHGESC